MLRGEIPIPLKQYSGNPYVLELFCGQSIALPRGRQSVRVLVRRIRALNYVVEVFPFPNNDIDCHPDEDWIIVSKIGDTSLRIIPIPFNRLKKKATEETRTAPFRHGEIRRTIPETSTDDTAASAG
jgi:hypothetical protein